MSARSFLDTNVLVYTDDASEPRKQRQALELYRMCYTKGRAVVSTQVLQEYFVATTRKLGVDPAIARRKLELFRYHGCRGCTRWMTFWPPLTSHASIACRSGTLLSCAPRWQPIAPCWYSEDLHHGFRLNGLQIQESLR